MNQPRRPPPSTPSPADRQVEAREDVERLAREFYRAFVAAGAYALDPWEGIGDKLRDYYRTAVTDILHRDVIRVGRRPKRERPMTDQMRFEEQLARETLLP
jgi:hypothetical protein